jgi:diketogulonate reductase-like aldo/keto reductase
MTPMSGIPTLVLSDDHVIPVLGISVAELASAEAEAAVTAALDAGYRLIDTVSTGGVEEAVGRAIAKSGIAREELFIATTLTAADQGFQASQDACKASLARLGVDYIDLCLLNWPVEEGGKYIDAWGGLMKAQQVGDTRSIGVSNIAAEQLTDLIDLSFCTPVVNQLELHPLCNQAALRAVHSGYSIVTAAYGPLGMGTLVDHPAIVAVAAAHGKSPAQVLIRWNIQLGNVVIPGSSDPVRIAENIDVFDFELTPAEVETLNGLDDGTRFWPNPNV